MIVSENIESIGIIGGGISGLQIGRLLKDAGKCVTIYEQNADIGGVWRSGYEDYGIQIGRNMYCFCDKKLMHIDIEAFCKGNDIQKYIHLFVDVNEMWNIIQCKKKVLKLWKDCESNGKWVIEFDDGMKCMKDCVIIASGQYSVPKELPIESIHSSELYDGSVLKGKDVIVIGNGKSGVDCAMIAVKHDAKSVKMIARRPYYTPGSKFLGFISSSRLFYSRIGAWLFPPYYTAHWMTKALHKLCYPIKWLIHRIIEYEWIASSGPKYLNAPVKRPPIPLTLFYTGAQQTNAALFGKYVDSGVIDVVFGTIESFCESNNQRLVRLLNKNGSLEVKGDVIINATGYNRAYEYLSEELRSELDFQDDGLWLYRKILPIGSRNLDNLAFIGSELTSLNNMETVYVQSKWLVEVICGKMQLPSDEECKRDLERRKKYYRNTFPSNPELASQGVIMRPLMDLYLNDMKISRYRKFRNGKSNFIRNLFNELFEIYIPSDYIDLELAES